MSEFIGVVRAATGEILAVISPDSDDELDDPAYRFGRDDVEMIRVPRGAQRGDLSLADVAMLVENYRR